MSDVVDIPPSLAAMARAALRECDNDTDAAVRMVVGILTNDIDALRRLIRAAIDDAVSYRVEMALRHKRASIIKATTSTRGAVVALATGWTAALLDMPLANGVALREATREQVVAQADRYRATATDAGHKFRWLVLIAQAVPPGKVVGDVMDDERAAELFKETEQ
jgi:hypothetical protein